MQHESDLSKYIPQRPPFIMVSDLYEFDQTRVKSGLLIKEDNILVSRGRYTESGIIENMAQTAALLAGKRSITNNSKPYIGYIAAIKNFDLLLELPLTGEQIFTTVELKNTIMQTQIAMAETVNENGKIVARCELRIYMSNETSQDDAD